MKAVTTTRIAIGALAVIASLGFSSVAFADGSTPQTVKFTSTPPSDADVGGKYEVSATGGGSGNPIIFSVDESSDSVCNVTVTDPNTYDNDAWVTFVGVGTCSLDANQAGNDQYAPAEAGQSFFVGTSKYPPTPCEGTNDGNGCCWNSGSTGHDDGGCWSNNGNGSGSTSGGSTSSGGGSGWSGTTSGGSASAGSASSAAGSTSGGTSSGGSASAGSASSAASGSSAGAPSGSGASPSGSAGSPSTPTAAANPAASAPAALHSALISLHEGSAAPSSLTGTITRVLALAAVVLALGGMFVLTSRRRRGRTAGRTA